MSQHRLASVTTGVPDVAETRSCHDDFGLPPEDGGWLSTRDGGRLPRIVPAPARRLVALPVDQPGAAAEVVA